jgi:hypothetical protein
MQVLYQIKALEESGIFSRHNKCFFYYQSEKCFSFFKVFSLLTSGHYVGGVLALLNCLCFPASVTSRFQGVVGSHSLVKYIVYR